MQMRFVAGIILALVLVAARDAGAFCVSNDSAEFSMRFSMGAGVKEFKKTVPPQGRECCNWQEKSCNPTGSRTGVIQMSARMDFVTPLQRDGKSVSGFVCHAADKGDRFPMEAGGSVRAKLNGASLTLDVYNVDGAKRMSLSCTPYQDFG
jgi:hypothetical protein